MIRVLLLLIFSIFFEQTIAQIKAQNENPIFMGLRFGALAIAGDIDHKVFPGYGMGLSVQQSLSSAFKWEVTANYGLTYGLNAFPSSDNLTNDQDIFAGYDSDNPWFHAYQTRLIRLGVNGQIDLTRLGKRFVKPKYRINLIGGLGIHSHGTKLNLRNADGELYEDLISIAGFNTQNAYNTIEGRKNIRELIGQYYDNSYETFAPKEDGLFRLGDETNVALDVNIGIGIDYGLSRTLTLTLSHQVFLSKNDYLDGEVWRTDVDRTRDSDRVHYTSAGILVNMNALRNRDAPSTWSDPWDDLDKTLSYMTSQIDSLKEALTDEDEDGVIAIVDQQPRSRKNCPTDTKGVLLDSDGDGMVDCDDAYPYVNNKYFDRLLQNSETYRSLIDSLESMKELSNNNQVSYRSIELNKSIYFDSDSYELDLNAWKELLHITETIQHNQIKCIQIHAYTDQLASEEYNMTLSSKRATKVKAALLNLLNNSTDTNLEVNFFGEKECQYFTDDPILNNSLNRRAIIKLCP